MGLKIACFIVAQIGILGAIILGKDSPLGKVMLYASAFIFFFLLATWLAAQMNIKI